MQVADNQLTSVQGLGACAQSLETLNVSGNPLTTLQHLPARLPALAELFARGCSCLCSLDSLTGDRCPELTCIDAAGLGVDSSEDLKAACKTLHSLPELGDVTVTGAGPGVAETSNIQAGQASSESDTADVVELPTAQSWWAAVLCKQVPQARIINGRSQACVPQRNAAAQHLDGLQHSVAGDEDAAAIPAQSSGSHEEHDAAAIDEQDEDEREDSDLAERMQAFMSRHAISASAWPSELAAPGAAQSTAPLPDQRSHIAGVKQVAAGTGADEADEPAEHAERQVQLSLRTDSVSSIEAATHAAAASPSAGHAGSQSTSLQGHSDTATMARARSQQPSWDDAGVWLRDCYAWLGQNCAGARMR